MNYSFRLGNTRVRRLSSLFIIAIFVLLPVGWAVLANAGPLADSAKWPLPAMVETALEWPGFLPRETHPAPNLRPDLMPSSIDGDWQALIDATWGMGDPTEQQELFTLWRDTLDHEYACYSNHDVDIPSICDPLWAELYPDGVSRGRFQAMVQSIALAHQNSHTNFYEPDIWSTSLEPGVPLAICAGGGRFTHFGASVTLHEDGEFVYDVVDDHPLGLELGDVVLGFDGLPWTELYPQLVEAHLPIAGYWGTSDAAYEHHWRKSVGMNWHLFTTIDIRKYGTGEVQHLPTSLMVDPGVNMSMLGLEQLDVGIPFPTAPDHVSWGVLDRGDQRIGYIYGQAWTGNAGPAFEDACRAMVEDLSLDGLIIDFRTNYGGNMGLSDNGLSLLFKDTEVTIDFGVRTNPNDHLAMTPLNIPGYYTIEGDPGTFFNKPIAVLLGPGALSSGDQVALRMTFHPMARTFGKPTCAAFDGPTTLDMTGHPDFYSRYSSADAYLWDTPGQYLNHVGFPVEEEVWLEPEDVVQGIDTVVEHAVEWIGETSPMFRELVITGAGPGFDNVTDVHAYDPVDISEPVFVIEPYGVDRFGVNVAAADLDGDELDEILTGPGPGAVFGPQVRAFEIDGSQLPGLNFMAYGTNRYGVNVAGGDLDGDDREEIITGAGPGAVFGPHVRAFAYDGAEVTPYPGVSFFAYGTPKWGVNVSAGDIDGDGMDEIVTGAGPGAVYGPHVRGWNVDGGTAAPMGTVSFLAYGTDKFGVNVTCGDIDGDGIDEIVTGAGPGAVFGAHVRGWNVDGGTATAMANLSFFAWSPDDLRYGANVFSGADLNGNGRDEIVVGQGPDPEAGSWVKVYMYDGTQVIEWVSLEAYGDLGLTHGANVAAGHF